MWAKVIKELEDKNLVGPALPIACHLHPDVVKYVSEPGQLPQVAPHGLFCDKILSAIILTAEPKGDVLNLAKVVSNADTSVHSRFV
jgi:hypothetical protein